MSYSEFESKKNNETKKQRLNSGIPCRTQSCSKCCVNTHMPLTRIDIKRISKQGYRYKDFVIRRKRERYLKNLNGRCFFLGDNGCNIYSHRPDGCRLYPLVYNENTSQVVIHDLCQYGNMFKVSRDDIENLHSLIKNLNK
ncbi:YkgJ family cysteine cluster protein [Thermoproteota archaeon]